MISNSLAKDFSKKLVEEIVMRSTSDDFSKSYLTALFFGGGTASLLPEKDLIGLLNTIRGLSNIDSQSEITLECEPGTISKRKLKTLFEAGINRVSVCAQSFNNDDLKWLDRRHVANDSIRLIEDCFEVGIENIHVDLIFGLATQTEASWEKTLKQIIKLPVRHVSTYKLYVYKHGQLDRYGHSVRPEIETEALTDQYKKLYERGIEILQTNGINQYTLTEFSFPGFESKYIQNCFNGGDILPIGPGAFGRADKHVWENCSFLHLYGSNNQFNNGRSYKLSKVEAFKRDVLLGLWLLHVNLNQLACRYGITISDKLIDLIKSLSFEKLLMYKGPDVYLPQQCRFNAGLAMSRLALLSSEEWGSTIEESNSLKNPQMPGRYIKFARLFRTVRRDINLYQTLKQNPQECLSKLGFDLTDDVVKNLVNIVQNTFSHLPNLNDSLYITWKNIELEYERCKR